LRTKRKKIERQSDIQECRGPIVYNIGHEWTDTTAMYNIASY